VGIVLGCLLAVALAIAAFFFVLYRRQGPAALPFSRNYSQFDTPASRGSENFDNPNYDFSMADSSAGGGGGGAGGANYGTTTTDDNPFAPQDPFGPGVLE
jgi:hypothetical protein